jgi:hypothetical protein
LVGNTSEMKICEEFPANWMKKIIPNPIASTIPSLPALAQSSRNTAVRRKAVTAVGLRPKRSSEYTPQPVATSERSSLRATLMMALRATLMMALSVSFSRNWRERWTDPRTGRGAYRVW